MSFMQFVKPYPDGYEDFESGGTPVTAEILNTNYDGFLLALNEFLPELEGMVEANPSESATAGNLTKLKVGNSIYLVPSGGGSGSSVSFEQILSSGTKIGIITIDGNSVDVYAPTPSGGASAYSDLTDVIVSNPSAGQVPIYNEVSSKWENGTLPVGDDVSFNPIVSTGTKLGTITINNVDYDIYAPTQTNPALSDLTDTAISTPTDGQVIKYNSLTEKWENGDASGGTGGHTIIDENGNSMTARAGLQFVGGANVSDDSTNNKTIVDVASAGGIDGVFIDANDVIQAFTQIQDTNEHTYTATEDCVIVYNIANGGNSDTYIKVDNIQIGGTYSSAGGVISTISDCVFLKKGQTFAFKQTYGGSIVTGYTVYGIQTGTTHSKFQPVIYSLEEREIGVWTDGKPLYSKVVEIQSFSSSSPISIDVSSLNVDTMVDVVGEAYAISNNVITEVLYFPIYKFANVYTAQIRYSNNAIQIYHESLNEYTRGIVKILYTKTTDVAGSGSWTPQGVPTHHYSTDEQIVGTWIDGSTLYEKTLVFDNPTKDSYGAFYQYDCAYDSGNIDFARIAGINVYDSTDGRWYDVPYERLSTDENIQAMEMVVSHDYKCLVFFKNTQAYNLTKAKLRPCFCLDDKNIGAFFKSLQKERS